jgi:hypothetical protein
MGGPHWLGLSRLWATLLEATDVSHRVSFASEASPILSTCLCHQSARCVSVQGDAFHSRPLHLALEMHFPNGCSLTSAVEGNRC